VALHCPLPQITIFIFVAILLDGSFFLFCCFFFVGAGGELLLFVCWGVFFY